MLIIQADLLFDELVPHSIYYQACNCFNPDFRFHILAYAFYGTGAKEYQFRDFLGSSATEFS